MEINGKNFDLSKVGKQVKKEDLIDKNATQDRKDRINSLFAKYDIEGGKADNILNETEIKSIFDEVKKFDDDKDGKISEREFNAAAEQMAMVDDNMSDITGDILQEFVQKIVELASPGAPSEVKSDEKPEDNTPKFKEVTIEKDIELDDFLKQMLIDQGKKEDEITADVLEKAKKEFFDQNPNYEEYLQSLNGKNTIKAGSKVKIPASAEEADKADSKEIKYQVKSGEYWYIIIQDKYGVKNHKQIMEIVRQLKDIAKVDYKSPVMPKEITLPKTVTLKDGTEFKLNEDVIREADAQTTSAASDDKSQKADASKQSNKTNKTKKSKKSRKQRPTRDNLAGEYRYNPSTDRESGNGHYTRRASDGGSVTFKRQGRRYTPSAYSSPDGRDIYTYGYSKRKGQYYLKHAVTGKRTYLK